MISNNLTRWLLIGEGCVLAILVLAVMVWYLKSKTRRQETTIHVLLISMSYLAAMVFITLDTYQDFASVHLTWRIPTAIFTESMGVAALLALLLKYLQSNGSDGTGSE